jgi:MoxR-like ATPase
MTLAEQETHEDYRLYAIEKYHPVEEPFYLPIADEVELFTAAFNQKIPVLLKGPTGCGKTRFVEYMAWQLGRPLTVITKDDKSQAKETDEALPLVTVACHEDLTASDLVGRYLLEGESTRWIDGPLTRAVKAGAICYLDEVVEARHDSLAILHSLTDHRRALYLDRPGVVVRAPDSFMLVCSYNPAYRSSLKELKPSFRQRFVTLAMDYLPPEREAQVLVAEAGIDLSAALRLVECATTIRSADDVLHFEPPSTRVLVTAAKLVAAGATELDAAEVCIVAPLCSDGALSDGVRELAAATLRSS